MIFVCPGPLWPGPRAAVAKVRAPAAASTRPRARPVVLRPGVDWRSRRCPWIVSTTMALGLTVSIHDTKTAFRPTRRLIAAAARDWSRLLSMPHAVLHLPPLRPLLLLRLRLRLRSTTRRWGGTSWTYRMAATRPDAYAAAAARATPGGHAGERATASSQPGAGPPRSVQKTRAGGPRRPWAAPRGSSRPRRSSGSAWA